jgi:hypothetical protein
MRHRFITPAVRQTDERIAGVTTFIINQFFSPKIDF